VAGGGCRWLTLRAVAIVQAAWHAEIVDQCREAFLHEIARLSSGGLVVTGNSGSFQSTQLAFAALRADLSEAATLSE
jgi:6,7-dimethyl-8-ribityllumazine synthase